MTTVFESKHVQDLLHRASGKDQKDGDPRFKEIMYDLLSGLFQTIEKHNVTEDELWKAVNFIGEASPELGLIVPGIGLEHYMDVLMDEADKKQGITGGTPRTIEGPLYVEGAPLSQGEAVMSDKEDDGEVLMMEGVIKDTDGNPVPNAMVEVWHADTRGFYSHFDPTGLQADFNNRRRIQTGADGKYKFRSIMPVGYSVPPNGSTDRLMKAMGRHGSRPAHIHFFVQAEGYRHLTTQINIADDPLVYDDFAYATREELIPELNRTSDHAEINFDFELVPNSDAVRYELSERKRLSA
ncbi:dioxygenase family protein [Kordiimonas pumila]|uniref:Dioxygenase n=1 Tax=Kordiimonas pumila TaxID=2161677 RepID=A0ABV7D4L0_9PROT|nr:dioxygenase [Kordiimonas pumila]